MIIVTGRAQVHPDQRDAAISAARDMRQHTLGEPGRATRSQDTPARQVSTLNQTVSNVDGGTSRPSMPRRGSGSSTDFRTSRQTSAGTS
jgi:hypothetical protein